MGNALKVTPHEVLTRLEESGELKLLVQNGFCSTCVLRNLELYRYVDAKIKTGSKIKIAVIDAEIQFKVCKKTVFNILRSFK